MCSLSGWGTAPGSPLFPSWFPLKLSWFQSSMTTFAATLDCMSYREVLYLLNVWHKFSFHIGLIPRNGLVANFNLFTVLVQWTTEVWKETFQLNARCLSREKSDCSAGEGSCVLIDSFPWFPTSSFSLPAHTHSDPLPHKSVLFILN